jgi:hypothetical protein
VKAWCFWLTVLCCLLVLAPAFVIARIVPSRAQPPRPVGVVLP